MLRRLLAPASLVVVSAALAAGWTERRGDAAAAQPEPATGEEVYLRDCASCHGVEGRGTRRGVPLLATGAAGAYFYLSTGRMPIDEPDDPIERAEPAYDEPVLDALVAHVASLGEGPPVPEIDPGTADLALGGERYRLHCAQCHGSSGVGVALAAGVTAPPVLESTPSQVAASLAVGPGAMPSFHPSVLDEREVASIAAYVDELRDPADRGGLPMARSGRLDELAAAWGLGVVALVLGVRWVARR